MLLSLLLRERQKSMLRVKLWSTRRMALFPGACEQLLEKVGAVRPIQVTTAFSLFGEGTCACAIFGIICCHLQLVGFTRTALQGQPAFDSTKVAIRSGQKVMLWRLVRTRSGKIIEMRLCYGMIYSVIIVPIVNMSLRKPCTYHRSSK